MLTCLVLDIFSLSLSIECPIGCQLCGGWVAVVVVCSHLVCYSFLERRALIYKGRMCQQDSDPEGYSQRQEDSELRVSYMLPEGTMDRFQIAAAIAQNAANQPPQ